MTARTAAKGFKKKKNSSKTIPLIEIISQIILSRPSMAQLQALARQPSAERPEQIANQVNIWNIFLLCPKSLAWFV
jgi:hypothetical protein